MSVELDRYRSAVAQLEKKQRQFDKALADERQVSAKYGEERDQAEREAREKETKMLSLSNERDELNEKVRCHPCCYFHSLACLEGELCYALFPFEPCGKQGCTKQSKN